MNIPGVDSLSSKQTKNPALLKLAESLSKGNKKGALSAIRSRLNSPFANYYQQIVWKGWERALNRDETNALIFQLLNGLAINEAKQAHQDLKKKKAEILVRDHTQTDLSQHYISSWVSLLEIYCDIHQEKQ